MRFCERDCSKPNDMADTKRRTKGSPRGNHTRNSSLRRVGLVGRRCRARLRGGLGSRLLLLLLQLGRLLLRRLRHLRLGSWRRRRSGRRSGRGRGSRRGCRCRWLLIAEVGGRRVGLAEVASHFPLGHSIDHNEVLVDILLTNDLPLGIRVLPIVENSLFGGLSVLNYLLEAVAGCLILARHSILRGDGATRKI